MQDLLTAKHLGITVAVLLAVMFVLIILANVIA
jgi:hypothetical protein